MSGLDCHAKQGGNESCLRQRVVLSDSPHSSLADQMHCFHTPDRSPCAVERAVTFRQPYPLFDRFDGLAPPYCSSTCIDVNDSAGAVPLRTSDRKSTRLNSSHLGI